MRHNSLIKLFTLLAVGGIVALFSIVNLIDSWSLSGGLLHLVGLSTVFQAESIRESIRVYSPPIALAFLSMDNQRLVCGYFPPLVCCFLGCYFLRFVEGSLLSNQKRSTLSTKE